MTTPLFSLGVGLLPIDIEAGATVTFSWNVDVQRSLDGTEQRFGVRSKPQQRYAFSAILDDAKGRAFLSLLAKYAHTAPEWRLPLPYEALTVASSTSGAITFGSLASCDWAVAGQPVVVRHKDGTIAETVISSPSGSSINVDDDVSAVATFGASVMPVMPVVLDTTQSIDRWQTGASRFGISAHATFNRLGAGVMGTGATVATFESLPVWDWGVGVNGTVSQPLDAGGDVLNSGLVVGALARYSAASWDRALRITGAHDDWQWLKKFLDTVGGSRVPFLVPTGRPDLLPVGDASTGTLLVYGPPAADAPDYVTDWYPSLAHRRIRIVKTDGTSAYRSIVSAEDLGGTQELTLSASLAGAIARVEFLETCRIKDDTISSAWDSTTFETTVSGKVVQA